MMIPEGEVAVIGKSRAGKVDTSKEALPQRVRTYSGEGQTAEKPQASEQIVIEEISIDGMCGVY